MKLAPRIAGIGRHDLAPLIARIEARIAERQRTSNPGFSPGRVGQPARMPGQASAPPDTAGAQDPQRTSR